MSARSILIASLAAQAALIGAGFGGTAIEPPRREDDTSMDLHAVPEIPRMSRRQARQVVQGDGKSKVAQAMKRQRDARKKQRKAKRK